MGKWVHLATAPDQITAEIWIDVLHNSGIAAMIRPSDAISFMGVSTMGCRVQVQEEDFSVALEVLGEDEPEGKP